MRLQPGERLGPYEVTAWIASGGMGDLYQARDTRLNRTVAIKLLGADFAHDVEWRRRFDREAKTLAGLSHPHICVIHDVGEHQGERFLVLEYLEGETLADRLVRGPLPRELALRYAREIAGALDAAHRQGILHRDLKPSNVMLTKSGAKLLDFGISTLRAPASSAGAETVAIDRTLETAIVGTVPYLPPERLSGRPADERSDIFAFGAVLYEMLTGHAAFPGDSRAAVMAAVMQNEPPADDRISPDLNRLIRRCLAKDPDERWQTARDLVEAVNWIEGPPVAPPVATAASERSTGSRRWIVTGLAIAAVVVGLAIGWYAWSRPSSASTAPVVVLMDSTLPERVYDPQTRAEGGTNSDDINDALRDLPLELHKETTSAIWHREEQLLRQHPALIVMHLSSFAKPSPTGQPMRLPEAVERCVMFLGFIGLASPGTRFLVYTRGFTTDQERADWTAGVEQRFPELKGRVQMVTIPGGDAGATFRDPATRKLIREQVLASLPPLTPGR